jgi:hypothetical protein
MAASKERFAESAGSLTFMGQLNDFHLAKTRHNDAKIGCDLIH